MPRPTASRQTISSIGCWPNCPSIPPTATLMPSIQKYFDPQTLAKLPSLELRARHIVEGYAGGAHRSPYRGFGVEFAEHRDYVPGDDTRAIDWRVWGKTDKLFLKQFEEQTNL